MKNDKQTKSTIPTIENRYAPDGNSQERVKGQQPALSEALTKELTDGKLRRLRFFELLQLKYTGWVDGRAGLPKQNEFGDWSSAILRKELDAYEEYCDGVWGKLQVDLQWAHMACDKLIDAILRLRKRLDLEQPPVLPDDAPEYHIRKRGEEALSDSQVYARRKRKAEARLASVRGEHARMQQTLREHYEELSLLHGFIQEAEHAASLVCKRLMSHTEQRIDVYWRAAYRVHPDSARMPASHAPLRPSYSEAAYRERHAGTEAAIEALLASCMQAPEDKQETEEMMEVAV